MSHYKSNLRDIEFNLFEVLGRDEVLGTGPVRRGRRRDRPRDPRRGRPAGPRGPRRVLRRRDRNPPVFDPETNTAPVPESFKKSYQAWMDAEYWRLGTLAELGGTPAPSSLNWAIGELVLGANPPIWMYGAGPAFAGVLHRNGNERDKQIAQLIVDKQLGHHDGADRARRRLRRRRRPHQGHRRTTTAPGTSRASSASSPRPSTT